MNDDIAARMDRLPLTALHGLALVLCTVGFLVDLIEIGLGTVLASVFSTGTGRLPAAELSLLLSSVYVGAIVGAPLLGAAADRMGRRLVMMGVLALLALTSLAGGLSPDTLTLTLARGLSGLALGAFPPLMMSYLTDVLPPARRGRCILVVTGAATLGLPAGVFVVRWLTPMDLGIEPWRLAFLAGAAASAIVAALYALLPESPRWLASRGRLEEAQALCERFERSPAWTSAAEPANPAAASAASMPSMPGATPGWPRIAALFLLGAWSTVTFPLLTGAVLAAKGFNLSDTLLYLGLSTLGPTVGTLVASLWIDRFERRVALGVCCAVLLVAGAAFVATGAAAWLVASSFLFGVFAVIYAAGINIYAAELFPTHRRAGSLATAWAFNRLGAAIAPLVLLPLLRNEGPLAMFGVIALCLVLNIALLASSPRGRERRAVA